MKSRSNNDSRIAPLDGWRTVSVVLVIFSHLMTKSSIAINVPGEFGRAVIMPILNECGSLGVSIFFVISGYVITSGLIREDGRNGRISLLSFYLRRGFRILPPLMMYVIAILALAHARIIPSESAEVVKALSFTCNLTDCGGWFGGHTWSLAYEEQFYLVIPLLFLLCWKTNSLLFFVLPAVLGVITLCAYPFNEHVADFFGHFVAIATGVAWATREILVLDICRRFHKYTAVLAPIMLIAAMRLSNTRYSQVSACISPTIIAFILVRSTFIDTSIANKLSTSWITYAGRISYSIYLWQQLTTFAFPGARFSFYFISTIICLLWAAASYKFVEAPLIKISHSISRRVSPIVGAS